MNNGVTKQKIWRDNTSLFIRVMMGIHIFIGYLNVFFALSMCFINLIKSQEIISYIEKYFSEGLVFNKSDYGANFIIEFYNNSSFPRADSGKGEISRSKSKNNKLEKVYEIKDSSEVYYNGRLLTEQSINFKEKDELFLIKASLMLL